jgi:acetyl esterase/lipase
MPTTTRVLRLALAFIAAALVAQATARRAVAAPPSGDQARLRDRQQIPLWPGTAPGSAKVALEEKLTERGTDPARPDRALTGVTKPSLTVHLPRRPNGAALIVASGGGYEREVVDQEGIEVAAAFVPKGITVFLLKYRLPSEGHEQARDVPLQDAQRAVRVVRGNAARWGLDPARIGVLGFSAGGHLAANLGARFMFKVYDPVDPLENVSPRPDFVVLLYPVISMEDDVGHAGARKALLGPTPDKAAIAAYSPDLQVGRQTPRTLLILADDDTAVVPENSIRYYQALKRAGIPAELHIFARGGHGFGIRKAAGLPVATWPKLTWDWLAAGAIVK